MAVIGFASGSDRHKPDSTGTNSNGDIMTFTTGVTIQTTPLLAPGSTKIRFDLSVSKQLAESLLGFIQTSATEYCVTFILKQTAAVTINHTIARRGGTNNGFSIQAILSGGVTKWRFYYDAVQIGSDFTPTINRHYRVGIYVKLGTLGAADSTYKAYIDDVTAGDIAVGAATNVVSTTTATFTNTPVSGGVTLGAQANVAVGGSGSVLEFQHVVVMDTSGSFNNSPATSVLSPICVTERSVPLGVGNYAEQSTGTFADVDELPPDDATTVVTGVLTAGASVKRVSFDMTLWATVGGSATDTLLAVRNMWRIAASAANVQFETLLRSGSTDAYPIGGNTQGTPWTTYVSSRDSDPNTSAAWTLAAYDAAEAGGRFTRFGADLTGKCTLIGMDGVFIRPAPGGKRTFAAWQ